MFTLEEHRRRYIEVPGPLDTPCHVYKSVRGKDFTGRYPKATVEGLSKHGSDAVQLSIAILKDALGGVMPEGKPHTLHLCDNPPCIRRDHLEPGSNAENQRQKALRGRGRGGRNKLTPRTAQELYGRWRIGERPVDLAKEYNITQKMACFVFNGRCWSRYTGARLLG